MTREELYKSFLKAFPNYEPMIRKTYLIDSNTLQVFTKQGKSFIFEQKDGDISLRSSK